VGETTLYDGASHDPAVQGVGASFRASPPRGVIWRSRDSPMGGCPSEGRLSLLIRTAWPKGILPLTQARLHGPGRWVKKRGNENPGYDYTFTIVVAPTVQLQTYKFFDLQCNLTDKSA
jgi:hypothetical protein